MGRCGFRPSSEVSGSRRPCGRFLRDQTHASLPEVKRVAEKARDNSRTSAVAVSPAILPSSGQPTFTIGDNEMFLGIGAHGEKGVRKTTLLPADETAMILTEVVRDL